MIIDDFIESQHLYYIILFTLPLTYCIHINNSIELVK